MYISHKAVIELSVTEVGSRHLIVSSKGVVVDFNIIDIYCVICEFGRNEAKLHLSD